MKFVPLYAAGFFCSLLSFSPQAFGSLWTGAAADGAYTSVQNWDDLTLPDSTSDLLFMNLGYPVGGVSLSDLHSARNLTISGGTLSFLTAQAGHGFDLGRGLIEMTQANLTFGGASGGLFKAGSLAIHSGTLNLHADLEIDGGNESSSHAIIGGSAGESGVFNHNSGTLTVKNGAVLNLGGAGAGTYNLNAGAILSVGGNALQGAAQSSGSYQFNLGGGRILVSEANLVTSVHSTIATGRSVIDTNGFDATWSGDIVSNPDLAAPKREFAKEGAGTLIFDGASRQMHAFATLAGTTRQTAGDTSSNGFLVAWGVGNSSTYEMNGGTLSIYSVDRPGDSPLVGTLRVGDYGGTGVFEHNEGEVILEEGSSLNIGNLGGVLGSDEVIGSGTYNLNGGTLTLRSGLHNVGRSAFVTSGGITRSSASNGALNMSDGLLHADGGQLILGSRDNFDTDGAGVGVFTQTGGVADFTNGALRIGSHGRGVYNLNGGELKIGGSNQLTANYGSSAGTYEFNLGGGKLTVAGSNLVTSVSGSLVAATTSTIDTAGFSASFNSALSGAGDLRKIGVGELAVQTLSAGKVAVDGGALRATNLTTSEVELASGTTLRTGTHSVTRFISHSASLGATSGVFRLAAGSRLEGSATLLSATEVSGTVFVGTATEAGSVLADSTLAALSGSRFEMGLFENSNDLGSYSRIVSEDGFTFSGSIALHLRFGDEVDFSSTFWETYGQEWLLFGGEVSSTASFTITSDIDYSAYGTFVIYDDGVNGMGLRWQAIPEPSTYALMVLSAVGMTLLRRRKAFARRSALHG